MTEHDKRGFGFVRQAGIEIPAGVSVTQQEVSVPQTVEERLRGIPARTAEPIIGIESAEYASQLSPKALRRAKRQMGIRYMGQPR